MKKAWLLLTALILIPSALAVQEPALQKNDFSITVRQRPDSIRTQTSARGHSAFNVTINAKTHEKEFNLTPSSQKLLVLQEEKSKNIWGITGSLPSGYDLPNTFKVVSWDNTTQLEPDPIPDENNQKIIEISGRTDPAIECNQSKKCRTTILVNEKELGKADEDGSFTFNYELKEGENQLKIVAKDPGDNKNIQTLTTSYMVPFYRKYQWPLIGAGILLALFAAVIVGLIVKKSTEKEIGETKHELTEKELKKLRKKERKLLKKYGRGGGGRAAVIQLKEVWEEVIERDPEFQDFIKKEAGRLSKKEDWKKQMKEREKKYMKKIDEIDEPLHKLPGGMKSTLLENYVSVLKKQLKEQIKKEKLS